ncbi:MAG: hypothetical protein ACU0A5_22210 [Salipiger marinus]|uniref:hypothetical protein n=1 Tax=Salipiger marinus TaxID=555512 RepID=UPI00405932CD
MTEVTRIFAPILIWLGLFTGVYALHGLGCGLGWPQQDLGPASLHRVALIAAWGVAILLQAAVLYLVARPWASHSPLVQQVTVTLAISAVVAMVWTLFPVAFASSCG